MANLKVSLYWHCKTEVGWRRFPAIFGRKNGRLRTGIVIVGGEERTYPEGHFHLRTYKGDRTVFRNVGSDPSVALAAQQREEIARRAEKYTAGTGIKVVRPAADLKSLAALRVEWMEHVCLTNGKKGQSAHRLTMKDFFILCRKANPDEIEPNDVLRFVKFLKEEGFADHTIFNRTRRLVAFLKFAGVTDAQLPEKRQLPQQPDEEPEDYSQEDLATFFAGCAPEYSLMFEFLWKTGLREKEFAHTEWDNLQFGNKVVTVRNKKPLNFRIKTGEERTVPLLDAHLIAGLKAWRERHPNTRFVFGTKNDKPRRHLIRTLKSEVRRLGLNCGVCDGCKGETKECGKWILHKFRATFATTWIQKGLDIKTLQRFMGHKDIESTMRYLARARDKHIQEHFADAFVLSPTTNVVQMPKRNTKRHWRA